MESKIFNTVQYEATEIQKIKHNYLKYKDSQKDSKSPYAIIDKKLSLYFPYLSNGAIKLYMLYVFQAKNNTGESWHSTQSQADSLNVTRRSIDKWNSELLNAGLICRLSNNKSSMSTFILPISDFQLICPRKNMIIYDNEQIENIDGKLNYIFHLYQWRKNKDTEKYDQVYGISCFIYERKIQLHKGNSSLQRTIRKIVVEDRGTTENIIFDHSNDELTDEFYLADLTYINSTDYANKFNIDSIRQQGFVLSSKFNLQNKKELLKIVSELADDLESIDARQDISSVQMITLNKT
ncbi:MULTISPECIES: hypothetical protein [Lactobacillales]|jgi:hypothetical protein|uniref:Helix-turn-helix domain-containing protein n=1 Tax=Streptococcus thermophilus TaxID=1308 RepID=A0A2H5CQ76_STRTR|nr:MULTISPECIES: hypothetical protein [Lactobacillales]AUH26702.1 hypothetical protein [Streptococcus thermophilus]QPB61171.1 hypothetical protein GFB65_13675 [Enterococcus faecalis]